MYLSFYCLVYGEVIVVIVVWVLVLVLLGLLIKRQDLVTKADLKFLP